LILGGRRYWWRGRRGRITSEELAWWKTLGNLGKSIRAWTTASKNELVTFTRNNYGIDISSFPDFAQRAFGHLLTGAKPTKAEYKALRREYRRSEYGRRGERVSTVEGKQLRSILSMYAKEFKPRSKTWGGGSGGDVDANTGKPLRPAQIRKTTTDGTIDTTGWTKQDLYNYARVHGAETTDVKSIYEKNYQQWKTADVVKPLTLLPEFSAQAGEFTVIAGEAIKNIATGKIIGYIGPSNSLMDLHGTVIGSYEGDRKEASKVYLAEFKSVPKREGIPVCAEKNYEKAKKYLVELMEKGEVPGGSVLVQRHGEWVYMPPRPENEWIVLDTGEKMMKTGHWGADEKGKKIYFSGYAELDKNSQAYLNKYGITSFNTGYIPAQIWWAETTEKKYQKKVDKLKPYFIESKVPEGIVNPKFVNFIKGLAGYNLIQIMLDKVLPDKDLQEIFGKKAVKDAREICGAMPDWKPFQSSNLNKFKADYPEFVKWLEKEQEFGVVNTGVAFRIPGDKTRASYRIPVKYGGQALDAAKKQGITTPTQAEWIATQEGWSEEWRDWFDSLPAKHPAKLSVIAEGIETAALVGTLYAPQIWAGTGVVTRALTIPKLGRYGMTLPLLGRVTPNTIPSLIMGLVRFTATTTPIAITGVTIEESIRATDLDYKWGAFKEQPANTQDYWAKQSGYTTSFDRLNDTEKANVLLHYSVPPDYTLMQWSQTLSEYQEKLLEYSAKGADWLREKVNWRVSEPVIIGGGLAVGITLGVSYMAQLPLIAGTLTYEIPKGTAKDFTIMIATGMALFFTTEIPKMVKADPALGVGTVVGLFLLSPGGLVKFFKGLGVKGSLRYVPERGRIRGTKWSIEVLNVPYQRVVKNTSWAATPDITAFGDVVKISKMRLFPSPEMAMRFMLSTSKGKVGKHPGLIEVHSSKADTAYKTLGKGEVELEIPLQYKTLDAVKGYGGKGISSNAYVGVYPIRRYTIRGEGLAAWKGPTGKQLAEVRLLSSKEGAIDALVGWHHRWNILKQTFAKDPKVKKLDSSIKQVKSEKPELTKILPNGQHQILYQRRAIPHPISGEIKPRVKGIITRADGRVMLVKDRSGKAYELPGGSVDVKDIILKGKFAKDASKVTWEQALASQVMGETMVGLTKIKYLDLYMGKVSEHAFSGARIFEATAVGKANRITAWRIYQKNKYGYREPELASIEWWKAGDKGLEVLPATLDILKAKMGIEGLRAYIGSKTLLKARDIGFADRVKKGKPVNEAEIKKINEAELKALKDSLNELLKGKDFSLKEYLTSSEEIALLMELIKGRRTAVKYIKDAKITDAELKSLYKHPELLSQEGWKLINEVQKTGRKLTVKESNFIIKDLDKSFDYIMKWENNKLGKLKEELEKTAYKTNEGYYNRAYSRYYYGLSRPVIAAVGYAGRVPYQDEAEIARHYAKILDRDRTPIPAVVARRIIPDRRKPPRGGIPIRIPPPAERPRVRPIRIPPPTVPPDVPPPKILPFPDTVSRLTKKQREGIIAWKQGWCYKLIFPPYFQDNIINSRKPLAGVKYYKGAGSAMKSIIARHGYVPPEVLRDMGIQDLIIRTPWEKKSKPKIFFKRDIKQRTRTTPSISGVR